MIIFGLSVKNETTSKITRLKFLPRMDLSVDIFGKKYRYTQAPFLEMAYNLYKTGLSKENFIKIISTQISETREP